MLSPGKWHLDVPKGYLENLQWRRWVLQQAHGDRNIQRGLLAMCRDDVLFFINTFVWQFNPKHFGDEVGPFITWDFQDEALLGCERDGEHIHGIIECMEQQEDVRWPKSREMGVSWVVLMAIDWLCLFHNRKKGLVISRDEDAVDRPDDPDSLFWKLNYIHENLPDWMSRGVTKRKMGFSFPATKSTIYGEANTVKAGVGGRASIALFDEFGQFKDGKEIYSRTADTADCRVFVYTHKDTQSMAYELSYDPKYSTMREICTHWSQHPEKNEGLYRYNEVLNKIDIIDKTYDFRKHNFVYEAKPIGGPYPGLRSPWYDKQCIRRPERAVSMDLDIDPTGATTQFFNAYTIKILQNTYCTEPIWTGELKFDLTTGKPTGLEQSDRGLLKLWINPKSSNQMPVMSCALGADPSWGTGATPTCFSGFNASTGEKILEYVNANITPSDAAALYTALGWLFQDEYGNPAKLCWEIPGPGIPFGRKIIEMGYRNVYYREDEDSLGKIRDNKMRPGWMNVNAKALTTLMESYADALRYKKCLNRSKMALQETLNFIYTSTGIEYKKRGAVDDGAAGSRVHHGDIVIADAQAWMMVKDLTKNATSARKEEQEMNIRTLAGRRKLAQIREREEMLS